MEFIDKSLVPLVKKYPLLSKIIVGAVILDIIYYSGKAVGQIAYDLLH